MNVFMYQGALLCETCGEDQRRHLQMNGKSPEMPEDENSYDSDDYPKGPYGDGGGEADSPSYCDECHVFLENPITEEGYQYVKECVYNQYCTVNPRGNGEVIAEWMEFYDIPNPNDEDL